MVERRTLAWWVQARCVGLLVVAVVSGLAAEELGPILREKARVSGRVHLGPSPIAGGWIEFYPVDGTVGDLRSAPIRPDGTFEATGVAAGTNLIRLAHPSPLPATPYLDPNIYWLFQQTYSPMRRKIPAPSGSLDIDLRREAQAPETARAMAELARRPG